MSTALRYLRHSRFFGEGPVADDLGFDADLFLGSESADGDPFFDHRLGQGQVGIILVAVD
jgi:hypothetical protein